VQLVGGARAKTLLYTGRLFGAADALRFGLVDEIAPTEALEARTTAFATEIAGVSQFSVQSMKRVFRAIDNGQSRDDESTTELFLAALHGEDYREGLAAVKEGRAPRFSFR
jgi:enoyl-CoA hydratase/carnithine racemase